MAQPKTITAYFFGGPRDGQIAAVPHLSQLECLLCDPVPVDAPPATTITYRKGIYEWHPFKNGAGQVQHRYYFRDPAATEG